MKFSSDDILYYVCPFIFTIDKIKVNIGVRENDGVIYYIDQIGAYLREEDLFEDLEEARQYAIGKLIKFYDEKYLEILNNKPKFDEGC